MKLKFLLIGLVASFTIFNLVKPAPANALSGSQFKAGDIIDDAIFFNPVGMSASQIQTFLNAKVPSCDTNGQKTIYDSSHGDTVTRKVYSARRGVSTPFICLKNYSQNTPAQIGQSGLCSDMPAKSNQSAAQIIYDIGNACGINPKVLIVLLQKEQALVTDDWPWPVQYQKATGYGCPDTAPCDSQYYGFFNQVYSAAWQFKEYPLDSNSKYKARANNNILWNPNTNCGSSTVYIENQATAGLYNYTPYRPNQAALNNLYGTGDSCSSYGNRNFWRYYNDWFGSTSASYIVNVPGTSTLYLMGEGKRFGIPNQGVLEAYGFKNTPITSVSNSYLNSLTDGGTLSTLFTFEGSNTVRLADHGKHYGIPSSTVCTNWGLDCFNSSYVKSLPSFLSALIPSGGTLQDLMWTQTDGYSKMVNGEKSPIIGSLVSLSYTAQSATPIDTSINSNQPYTSPLVASNTLVKFGNFPSIYYFNGSSYYTFPSFNTYAAWTQSGVLKTYNDTHSTYASSPPTSSGSFSIYANHGSSQFVIDKGKKYYIDSVASDWPTTADHTFALAFLTALPSGTISSSTIFRDDSTGSIYKVLGKKRNVFPTLDYYFAYGGSSSPMIRVSSGVTESLSNGYYLFGEGAIFKGPSSDSIYIVAPGHSSSYTLSEFGQVSRLGGSKIWVVDNSTVNAYPSTGTFKDFLKQGSSYFALSSDKKRVQFNSSNLTRWGLNTAASSEFASTVTNNIGSSDVDPRFIVSPSGVIYYGYSGTKRPLSSYKKYLQLGGYSGNTFNGTKSFLNLLPTGSQI